MSTRKAGAEAKILILKAATYEPNPIEMIDRARPSVDPRLWGIRAVSSTTFRQSIRLRSLEKGLNHSSGIGHRKQPSLSRKNLDLRIRQQSLPVGHDLCGVV